MAVGQRGQVGPIAHWIAQVVCKQEQGSIRYMKAVHIIISWKLSLPFFLCRNCSNPVPANNGAPCIGSSFQYQTCNDDIPCVICLYSYFIVNHF